MESKEVIDRIEEILDNKINQNDESIPEGNQQSESKTIKDILYLGLQFFLNILKSPFKIVARYLRDELIDAIKKDTKIYALIMGIMGVLFVIFSVLWLFISVAVGVYFYDSGSTIVSSILFSIIFQLLSFVIIALLALFTSSKLSSIKMMKKIKTYKD